VDKEKIYDFLIKGSKLITALAVFSALFVTLVKYANKDFENRVERFENRVEKELDTIKNNHIFHLNKDIQEIKEEHKEMRQELKQQSNDISYIKKGLLEKQFGIKK
jgi:septal ring factor EnvC (AmiA/AmiB activator)